MKRKSLISATVFALIASVSAVSGVSLAQQPQRDDSALKLSTDLVSLNVTVLDRNGNAVNDLKKEDFRVFENGVEQSLSFFSTDEAPVSWGLILDRSRSMRRMIRDVYQAALHVMDEGTDQDEMFVATFNHRVELLAGFTTSRPTLQNAVAGLQADGNTALYDAVAFGLNLIQRGSHRKKVLVVVTDGEDNSSRMSLKQLVERAKEADVLIYTIGMFGNMGGGGRRQDWPYAPTNFRPGFAIGGVQHGSGMFARAFAEDELKKLAEVTGAKAHFPSTLTQCREAMAEIALEVSRQYSIGYYPSNTSRDGKWRKLQVKAGPGTGKTAYVARAQAGYYAPKSGGAK